MTLIHSCGTPVDAGLLMCPVCGGPLDEVTATPPGPPNDPVPAEQPEQRCSTPWCRRVIPAGSTDCPFCGAPVATPGPVPDTRTTAEPPSLLLPNGVRVPIDHDLVVGRETGDQRIDAALDPFTGVSRRHARVSPAAGGVRVTDLGSLNGTTVNGRPARGQVTPPPLTLGLGRSCSVTIL